jgi:chromosome segregation ATPase
MSETMSPRAFVLTAQQLIDEAIELKAENAYFRRALAQADDIVKAERTDMIRVTAHLEGLEADKAKLEVSVRELQEALAEAAAHNASLERLNTAATFRSELTRKLNDREHALAASRGRAAKLQQRINTAAGHIDNARLSLVDSIIE